MPGFAPHCPVPGEAPGKFARGESGSQGSAARGIGRVCRSRMSGRGLSAFTMGFPAPSPQLGVAVPRGGIAYPSQRGWDRLSRGAPGDSGCRARGRAEAEAGGCPSDVCSQGQGLFSSTASPGQRRVAVPVPPRCCLRHPAPAPGVRPGSDVGNRRAGLLGRAADPGWEKGQHPWSWGEARPRRGPGAASRPAGSRLQLRGGRGAAKSPPGLCRGLLEDIRKNFRHRRGFIIARRK